jgi:hypothetical protein
MSVYHGILTHINIAHGLILTCGIQHSFKLVMHLTCSLAKNEAERNVALTRYQLRMISQLASFIAAAAYGFIMSLQHALSQVLWHIALLMTVGPKT